MGVTIVATNVVIIGSMTFTNLMPSLGIIPIPQSETRLDPRISAMALMLLIHVPLVYTGFAVTCERFWGIVVSLVSGLLMTTIFTSFMLGFIPIGSQFWDDVPGFRVVYTAMSMLVYLQTIASGVALMAWKEKRKRLQIL